MKFILFITALSLWVNFVSSLSSSYPNLGIIVTGVGNQSERISLLNLSSLLTSSKLILSCRLSSSYLAGDPLLIVIVLDHFYEHFTNLVATISWWLNDWNDYNKEA